MTKLRKDTVENVAILLYSLTAITEEKIEGYTYFSSPGDLTFVLTEDPVDVNDVTAKVNGVEYTLNTDYTITGTGPYTFTWITPSPNYTLNPGDYIQLEYEFATAPVRGLPITGLDDTDVTVYYRKNTFGSGATLLALSPGSDTVFVEVDAVNMPGVYELQLPASVLDTEGPFTLSVKPVVADTFADVSENYVVEQPLPDIELTPSGVSINDALEFIYYVSGGRWKVNTSHISGNPVLELYEDDNSTLFAEFDLLDAGGSPTAVNPFERLRRP